MRVSDVVRLPVLGARDPDTVRRGPDLVSRVE